MIGQKYKNGGLLGETEGRRGPQILAGLKFRVEVWFVCDLLIVFVLFLWQVLLECELVGKFCDSQEFDPFC